MAANDRPTRGDVLVVDDDDDIRETLCRLLEEEGYGVTCAANGQEALGYLRAAPVLPRVILLDLMMPVMNGWEFRGVQKKDPLLSSIPVVVISASGAARERVGLLGVEDVIQKPFEVEDLLRTVDAAADRSRPSRTPAPKGVA